MCWWCCWWLQLNPRWHHSAGLTERRRACWIQAKHLEANFQGANWWRGKMFSYPPDNACRLHMERYRKFPNQTEALPMGSSLEKLWFLLQSQTHGAEGGRHWPSCGQLVSARMTVIWPIDTSARHLLVRLRENCYKNILYINVAYALHLCLSVEIHCSYNTGINAVGEREHVSPAISRTD